MQKGRWITPPAFLRHSQDNVLSQTLTISSARSAIGGRSAWGRDGRSRQCITRLARRSKFLPVVDWLHLMPGH